MVNPKTARVKRKVKKKISEGIVHVNASFNNTIITITDRQGNTVAATSAGSNGFRGSRKGTPFAAQVAAEKISVYLKELDMKRLDFHVAGPGLGRDATIRAFYAAGFIIEKIIETTGTAYNGCRSRKKRRV